MGRKKHAVSLIALSIAMFMSILDSTIINIALPDITKYFKESLTDTSWISTIYVMGLSIFMITASKLADQFGRKKVMLIGLALFGISSALSGLSGSLLSLIVMRFIQGIGGAIITPLVIPMALEIFPREKSQSIAGTIGAVTAAAAAGGPPIGGLIIQYLNWQAIFYVNVPFAILSFLLITFFVKETYDETTSKKIDWAGMLLLTATLFLLTFALLKGNDYGWGSALIISMFAGSALSLALFLFVERRIKFPMIEFSLFREKTFTASTVCYAITGFAIASTMLIFSYFLQNALGYPVLDAAFIIMTLSLTVIVSMPLGSYIAGKFGARPVNFAGLLIISFGIFLLSRLQISTARPVLVAVMIVCGFGLGFASQALVSAIKHLPKEKSGMGSGIANAARQVGVCIGIALLVSVLTTNVSAAKNTIQNNAIANIKQNPNIVASVKDVMIRDINNSFKEGNTANSLEAQKDLENSLTGDIKNTLANLASAPQPGNDALRELYNGAGDLSGGAAKAADGSESLQSGINSLDSGLNGLQDGSRKLYSGSQSLDNGLSQALTGATQLSEGSQNIQKLQNGLGALSAGAKNLSAGLNALFAQFSSGTTGNPTLRDSVNLLKKGASDISGGLESLLAQFEDGSASNQTLKYHVGLLNAGAQALKSQVQSGSTSNLKYLADSLNNPSAGVHGYVSTSNALIAALRNSSNTAVYNALAAELGTATDPAQIQALSTTLALITDTANPTQTATTIALLGSAGYGSASAIQQAQSAYSGGGAALKTNINILDAQFSAGGDPDNPTLSDGINAIAAGTQELSAQMEAGSGPADPTLYDSIHLLYAGAQQLQSGANALASQMQQGGSASGITLYDNISALNTGAKQVYDGANQLQTGAAGLSRLESGIQELNTALSQLKEGSSKLSSGSSDLKNGIDSAKGGSADLLTGSAQLVVSLESLKEGALKIETGIGAAGQADEIQRVIDAFKTDKDAQTAGAFDATFLLAAVIIGALAVFGLFSDKKEQKSSPDANKDKLG